MFTIFNRQRKRSMLLPFISLWNSIKTLKSNINSLKRTMSIMWVQQNMIVRDVLLVCWFVFQGLFWLFGHNFHQPEIIQLLPVPTFVIIYLFGHLNVYCFSLTDWELHEGRECVFCCNNVIPCMTHGRQSINISALNKW